MRVHELKDGPCMSHDTVFQCFRIESCRCCHGVDMCGSSGSMIYGFGMFLLLHMVQHQVISFKMPQGPCVLNCSVKTPHGTGFQAKTQNAKARRIATRRIQTGTVQN